MTLILRHQSQHEPLNLFYRVSCMEGIVRREDFSIQYNGFILQNTLTRFPSKSIMFNNFCNICWVNWLKKVGWLSMFYGTSCILLLKMNLQLIFELQIGTLIDPKLLQPAKQTLIICNLILSSFPQTTGNFVPPNMTFYHLPQNMKTWWQDQASLGDLSTATLTATASKTLIHQPYQIMQQFNYTFLTFQQRAKSIN